MPVPTLVSELSTTAGSNSPSGSDSPTVADDHLRAGYSFIAQHRDGSGFTQESTIASAGTTDIGASTSLYAQITGTTTITSFGVAYNGPRFLRFTGILTLTHNATTLILPGGANITTAAGDTCIVVPNGNAASGWRVVSYERANGTALNGVVSGAITTSSLTMATDRVLGRVTAATGAIEELTRAQLAVISSDKVQPIDGTVASNALTITINPTTLDFRDSSLTSGTVNTRTIGSAITVVVPSGATLGTTNAVQALLAVLAIDNAGTVEAAVVNLSGGFNISESGLISTTTIGTGSDSASVAYSTTGRSNVPYRVVGFLEATQATAGTWATAPSVKQGAGGNAIASINGGRAWATVTGSRSASTPYYNTARHDKEVIITSNAAASVQFSLLVDGVGRDTSGLTATNGIISVRATVPPGSSYSLTITAGTVNVWSELG